MADSSLSPLPVAPGRSNVYPPTAAAARPAAPQTLEQLRDRMAVTKRPSAADLWIAAAVSDAFAVEVEEDEEDQCAVSVPPAPLSASNEPLSEDGTICVA